MKLQGLKIKRIRPYHRCGVSNIKNLACVSSLVHVFDCLWSHHLENLQAFDKWASLIDLIINTCWALHPYLHYTKFALINGLREKNTYSNHGSCVWIYLKQFVIALIWDIQMLVLCISHVVKCSNACA